MSGLAVSTAGRLAAASALQRSLADDGHQVPIVAALCHVEVVIEALGAPAPACPDCGRPSSTIGKRTPAGRMCLDCTQRVDDALYDREHGIGAVA